MGWTRCFGCEKLQRDFVAQTFALIAPVQYVLQQVSCSYKMIPNAPKYYEMHQNISLGCNGVDWVHSLRRILMWLRGTNFFINCTSSDHLALSLLRGTEFRFQWGGLGAFVSKNRNVTSWHELLHWLHQFSMFCNKFHAIMKRSQMHRNTTKWNETLV